MASRGKNLLTAGLDAPDPTAVLPDAQAGGDGDSFPFPKTPPRYRPFEPLASALRASL